MFWLRAIIKVLQDIAEMPYNSFQKVEVIRNYLVKICLLFYKTD